MSNDHIGTLERYERRTSGTLTWLALAFLVVYGAPIIWPDLPSIVARLCEGANVAIWFVFAIDLAVRVTLARDRWRYLARHPIDVLVVALPMLRPLRVLRVFAAGQALFTRGRGLVRTGQAIVFAAGVLVLIGALAILDAERGQAGANIETFPDALWWAMTTVTTVGYGDLYPVSGLGRGVAASLMLVGISLLGIVTATVATWFLQGQHAAEDATLDVPARLAQLGRLRSEGVVTEAEYTHARARLLDDLVT